MERKKKAEGIALLSMYNDDEDMDVDDDDDSQDDNDVNRGHHENGGDDIIDGGVACEKEVNENDDDLDQEAFRITECGDETSKDSSGLPIPEASRSVPSGMTYNVFNMKSRSPSPIPLFPTPPPLSTVGDFDNRRATGASLTIVDYAHDDSAWSPEEDETEGLNIAQVRLGAEIQGANDEDIASVSNIDVKEKSWPEGVLLENKPVSEPKLNPFGHVKWTDCGPLIDLELVLGQADKHVVRIMTPKITLQSHHYVIFEHDRFENHALGNKILVAEKTLLIGHYSTVRIRNSVNGHNERKQTQHGFSWDTPRTSYRTPPGSVRILTPNRSETAPSVPQHEEPKSDVDQSGAVKVAEPDKSAEATGDPVGEILNDNVDPLEKFLPPPPKSKCSEELQSKILKFLDLMKKGRSFNEDLRNSKGYRNPDFLQHAVRYQEIDQLGTCFSKDVFDPYGYHKSDYYDEIEAEMKREIERKEQEKKRNQKIEFAQGGLLSAPSVKGQVTVSMLSAPAVAANLPPLLPTSATSDAVTKDRHNKKSKWDKVDIDRRIPLPAGGQDILSAAGAHAALLSATNTGAGYSAFAQQKRKETAERKSSERSGKELGK